MKKMIKGFQWVVSISIILFGLLALFSLTATSGLLMMLSGLLVLPVITAKIPKFKFRKFLLIVISLILFFTGLAFSASDDTSYEQGENDAVATNNLSDDDKPNFAQWMNYLISNSSASVGETQYENWRNYPESEVFPMWQKCVLDTIQGLEIDEAIEYAIAAESIYWNIYEDSTLINDISYIITDLSQFLTENKYIEEKYQNIDFASAQYNHGTSNIYITQRLENEYSDSILGDLQKSYDDYTADGSYWVGTQPNYIAGTAFPGDTYYVFHSEDINPFSQSGVYNITYYDTGATTELKNAKGFVMTVPVYQIIKDGDNFSEDAFTYDAYEQCKEIWCQKLMVLLDVEKYADTISTEETIDAKTISGLYVCEDGSEYSLEMNDSYEGIHEGTLWYFDTDFSLYSIDNNRYLAIGYMYNNIVSFSNSDGTITMNIYDEDGILEESVKMSKKY